MLCKKRNGELKNQLNIVLKPKAVEKIFIVAIGVQHNESRDVRCRAKLETGTESYPINMQYHLSVPRILNPKLLSSAKEGIYLMRITINKLVTN